MRIEIDYTESAQKNAEEQYNGAKKLSAKIEGARKAIKDLEKKLADYRVQATAEEKIQVEVKSRKREWYEKFHWFFTSDNLLAIGGKDAKQNELVNSSHFDDVDLFFHADIFGASVTVLKEGKNAPETSKEETAHFAAAYSSAWKDELVNVDVYAVARDQVSKSTSKGSLGTGSFLISGERTWYRKTPLSLVMFLKDGIFNVVPKKTFDRLNEQKKIEKCVLVSEGKDKKSDAAKKAALILEHNDLDEIMRSLPAGMFSIKRFDQLPK